MGGGNGGDGFTGSNFSGGNRSFMGGPNFGSGANFRSNDFGNSANLTRSGAPSFSNITHSGAQNFANTSRDGGRNFSNFGSGAGGSRNFSSFQNGLRNNAFNASFSHNWQQGQHFAQFHGNNFNHFNEFCHRGGCFFTPFCFPWSWGWWGGVGWGLGFDYYSYVPAYCYDAGLYGTVVGYNGVVADTSATAPLAEALPPESPLPGNGAINADANMQGDAQTGAMFFSQAENAFQAGKYRDSFRLANHAAIESPENPRAPELMSLSLFALGEYPAAAAQAHFALALGPPTDWASIFGYYGDVATYTKQLRALEKYSGDNPQSVEGHFLLGYHYLITGYTKPALKELQEVVKLAPNDKLTAALVKKYGGDATPAQPPAPPAPAGAAEKSEQ